MCVCVSAFLPVCCHITCSPTPTPTSSHSTLAVCPRLQESLRHRAGVHEDRAVSMRCACHHCMVALLQPLVITSPWSHAHMRAHPHALTPSLTPSLTRSHISTCTHMRVCAFNCAVCCSGACPFTSPQTLRIQQRFVDIMLLTERR